MLNLNEDSKDLLMLCLEKHSPDLLRIINDKKLIDLNKNAGNELRDVVSNELIEKGFNGSEPNEYGLKLEKLIDEIGSLFMSQESDKQLS